MKHNSLEKLLRQDAPPPNPAARLAARRAALDEFARLNASSDRPAARGAIQGLLAAFRLSRNKTRGSEHMPWYSRRLLIGGAASVVIAMFGATLVWDAYQQDPRIAQISAPVESTARTAAEVPQSASEAPAADPALAREEQPVTADEGARQPGGEVQALRAQTAKQERFEGSRERVESAPAASTPESTPESASASASPSTAVPPPQAALAADALEAPQPAAAPAEPQPRAEAIVGAITAEDLPKTPEKKTNREGRESLDEVVVTGARGTSRARSGHKSTAPPARSGNPVSGWFSRKDSEPAPATVPLPSAVEGRDRFEHFEVNSVKQVADEPVSTFSADVDTASYSFVRKQLDQGVLPQKDAVRVEEMINYFDYSWPAAEDREQPFRPTIVVSDSPWGKGRKLIHIGIKGYELPAQQRPDANLVMLLDVSGSMSSPDKLPLVQQSMKLLLGSLKPTDTVAIVVYAGAAGQVLPPTPVGEKEKIIAALDSLSPGGSTAGAEGIELAYQLAESNFRREGVNRILLCTDGDFNVGIDSTEQLKGFVERKREKGVFLSVLGFGQGNYRDELAQALAQNGNGVAAYIDSLSEAQKVLVQESGASLFTIAKDVKLQVEFNPATVAEYRLVGYETRALKREDFNNDAIDAGDIGAGHTVTAIYEITPVGTDARMVDESRYSKRKPVVADSTAREYGFLKIRYKLPKESRSELIEQPIGLGGSRTGGAIQRDAEFSTAVAGFAQLLRGGQFTGSLTYDDVIQAALASRGEDPYGHRSEFVQLVRKAKTARGM